MVAEPHGYFVERFTALFNEPNIDIADEIMAPQFRSRVPLAGEVDLAGWKAYVQVFYAAFPDLHMDVHDVVSCGDKVVMRVTYRGTHTGPFQGLSPTGKPIAVTAIGMFQLTQAGQGLENWAEIDVFALMQQIGALPMPGAG